MTTRIPKSELIDDAADWMNLNRSKTPAESSGKRFFEELKRRALRNG